MCDVLLLLLFLWTSFVDYIDGLLLDLMTAKYQSMVLFSKGMNIGSPFRREATLFFNFADHDCQQHLTP